MEPSSASFEQRILLVRHGEAATSLQDAHRPLTERGAQIVQQMADWTAEQGIAVEEIRHSGILRAEQTANLFARVLQLGESVSATGGMAPLDDAAAMGRSLEGEGTSLMLVGHLPFLGRLTTHLLSGDSHKEFSVFEPGAVYYLRRQASRWELVFAMQPSALRSPSI